MRHFVIVGILVIIVAVLGFAGLQRADLMPAAASAQSVPIDWLWNVELATLSFLAALILVPMVYSLIVFRRRHGETGDGVHMEGNTSLEISWTIFPLLLVLVFAYLSAVNLADVGRVDPNPMIIRVRAQQWDWVFEYPEYGGFVSETLRIPVNRQILLKMESVDVLHSFWVPEFRIKQDVVPGRVTEYRVTPTVIGTYRVRCAELCGTSHYSMEDGVIVVSEEEFVAWAQEEEVKWAEILKEGGPIAGEAFVQKYGCRGCHTIDGSALVGPTWRGLFGSEVELADGSVVTADETYIRNSIADPPSQVVAGFPPMTFRPEAVGMTEEEIIAIVEYIATLR